MRKFLIGILSAALIAGSFSANVFAAEINQAEQRILDQLNTPYNISDITVSIEDQYINTVENFFLANNIQDEEADAVLLELESVKAILNRNADLLVKDADFYLEGIATLPEEDYNELLGCAQRICDILGLKLVVDGNQVVITDQSGKVWFSGSGLIKNTGRTLQNNQNQWIIAAVIGILVLTAGGTAWLLGKKRKMAIVS